MFRFYFCHKPQPPINTHHKTASASKARWLPITTRTIITNERTKRHHRYGVARPRRKKKQWHSTLFLKCNIETITAIKIKIEIEIATEINSNSICRRHTPFTSYANQILDISIGAMSAAKSNAKKRQPKRIITSIIRNRKVFQNEHFANGNSQFAT